MKLFAVVLGEVDDSTAASDESGVWLMRSKVVPGCGDIIIAKNIAVNAG